MGKSGFRNKVIYNRSSPFQTNYGKGSQSLKKQKYQFSFISNNISPSDIKVTHRSNHAKSFPSKMVFSTAVCRKFQSNISSSDQLKQDISPRYMLKADKNNICNLLASNGNIASHKLPGVCHSDINFTSRYPLNHQKIQLNSANEKDDSNVLKSLDTDENLDFYHTNLREDQYKSIYCNQELPKFQFPFQKSHNIQSMTDTVSLHSIYSNSDSCNKKITLNKSSAPPIYKKEYSQPLKSVKTNENSNQRLFVTSDDFLTTNKSNFCITPLRKRCLSSSSSSGSILSDSDIDVIENKNDFVLNVCKDSFCDNFFMKMSALELLSHQKSTSLSEITTSEASHISNVNCIDDRSCLYKVCVSRTSSCVGETGDNYCEIVDDDDDIVDVDDDCDSDSDSVVEEGDDVDQGTDIDHEHMLQNTSFSDGSSIISVDSYDDSDVNCIENDKSSNTDE
ncbi:uncharacterized protein LOC142334459 isoform X1 [Lycorma delicatula]|uniref:uncharacterized protein LOC142334459 isoform X1 n=1 Tax=Lycorma delicatula TaxID=130591 RepID=UPI003F510F75